MSDQPPHGARGASSKALVRASASTVRLVVSIVVAAALALYISQPGWFTAPAAAGLHCGVRAVPAPRPRPTQPHLYYLGQQQSVDNVATTPVNTTYTRGSGSDEANRGYVLSDTPPSLRGPVACQVVVRSTGRTRAPSTQVPLPR
jgi:hypothetical protein